MPKRAATEVITSATTRFVSSAFPGSGDLEVGSGGLAALHCHLVVHLLPVIQPFQSSGLDGGDVHEHILAAILRHDEAIAFRCIEPFDGSNGHCRHSFRCASPLALVG